MGINKHTPFKQVQTFSKILSSFPVLKHDEQSISLRLAKNPKANLTSSSAQKAVIGESK